MVSLPDVKDPARNHCNSIIRLQKLCLYSLMILLIMECNYSYTIFISLSPSIEENIFFKDASTITMEVNTPHKQRDKEK